MRFDSVSRQALAAAFRAAFLVAGVASLLSSCDTLRPARAPDPELVHAFTEGSVPRDASIKVVLASVTGNRAGTQCANNPFRLVPRVEGRAEWLDPATVAFFPDEPLAAGKEWAVEFDAGVATGAPAPTESYFTFGVRTEPTAFSVDFGTPRALKSGSLEFPGVVRCNDDLSDAEVEAMLVAADGDRKMSITWKHSKLDHEFAIRDVPRGNASSSLVVSWNGSRFGVPSSGTREFRIPAADSFEVLSMGVSEGDSGCVEIVFSDWLDRTQDLRGLVSLSSPGEPRFSVDGNVLRVWPRDRIADEVRVDVARGVLSEDEKVLAQAKSGGVETRWELPQVRFATGGVILPTTLGATLPIETMNLSAVYVEVLRVYGDTMLQFLQVNDLPGNREMSRVGKVVLAKVVNLDWKDDWRNKWVATGIDLSKLVSDWKDGMFQVRLSFGREHVKYVCPFSHSFSDLKFPPLAVSDSATGEESYWDYAEEWYEYSWEDRQAYKKDPCHPLFYQKTWDHDIVARRNVIVSDIGVVAKAESRGTYGFAITDMRTTQPMKGATVRLFDFTQQKVGEATTEANGFASVKPSARPVFAVVSNGKQTSYAKIDDGSALAISHFDVGGRALEAGLKGFIYGERGVWRPGDDIHLVLALWDRGSVLPDDHPVLFELENPRGQIVQSRTLTSSVNGFYRIDTFTNSDAPTGTWTARAKVGNAVFTKALKIESVMPNRLKTALSWGTKTWLDSGVDRMTVEASWLTGAPASRMKADVSVVFSAAKTSFPAFSDYVFDDPTRRIYSQRSVLFDGTLDDKGKAEFAVDLEPDGVAPGKLVASFLTRVFEPSGMFSSEQFSVEFFPYRSFVGVKLPKGDARGMLLTDVDQTVDLALVDAEGKPVSGEVEVSLYQLEWRWWWESGDESLAEYADSIYRKPIATGTAQVKNGRGSWKFQVKQPNWGRFLVRAVDKGSSHASGAICYVDWPGWAGRSRGDSGGSAVMLSLSTDKTKYAAGEVAKLTFPSNVNSRALVTIERAGTILSQYWVPGAKDSTVVPIKLDSESAPNVYAHVTLLQAHGQTANDLPIRLYGVVPIVVEDPATRLRPRLELPTEIQPESDVSFTVAEASGKAMTYTIAVVDEGLLSLTKYRTPDPWDHFYAKEASALRSWDIYKHVSNAFSGKLETMLAIGGSDELADGGRRKNTRFPPVVHFIGPKTLAAGAKNVEKIRMGRYFGAVRFMVVAGTSLESTGAAFGTFEKEVPVKAPLMVLLTAPRVLSPGETCAVKATVFSYTGTKAIVTASLKAEGALKSADSAAKTASFAADGDQVLEFPVSALDAVGKGKITVTATSGGRTATQTIDLEIRPVSVESSAFKEDTVAAGGLKTISLDLPGMIGTNSLTLELSLFEPLDISRRLEYLIGYPHGCAEQTVSKAFPQVMLGEAVQLSPAQSALAKANVNAAIGKLGSYQVADGGFSVWAGSPYSHEWLTVYVTHFLLEARRYGHDVPPAMLDEALESLVSAARTWNSKEDWSVATQAYRLYALALAGKADYAGLNRLRGMSLDLESTCRLASAYALAGMADTGKNLFAAVVAPANLVSSGAVYYMTYWSPLRAKAVMLETATRLGDSGRAYQYYKELSDALRKDSWYSTQETAYALVAAVPYVKALSKAGETSIDYIVAGTSTNLRMTKPVMRVDLSPGKDASVAVAVRNNGKVPVYARLSSTGMPAGGKEKSVQDRGIQLRVDYLDMNGRYVSPEEVPLYDDMEIEVTVVNRSGKRLSSLALSHLLCAGWELRNLRLGREDDGPGDEEGAQSVPRGTYSWWWWWSRPESVPLFEYQDIRDAAVYTYFDLLQGQTKIFRLYVNKTYEGNFLIPALKVEAMYEPSVFAIVPGKWTKQTKGK